MVLRQVELLQIQVVKVFDARYFILAEGQRDQALVTRDSFNLFYFVVVQAEMFDVWVETNVFNRLDIIVRVIYHFQVCRWGEVKHILDAIVACVELYEMLDVRQVLQRRQLVV